jgi:ribonuclease G
LIRIFVLCSPGEIRVAVADDDHLLDYAIFRPGAPDGVGDLHRGRVINIVPAMAGAFVAVADAEGFLPDSEGAAGLTQGATLGVRVTRAAQGGKGPRLSAKLDQTGIGSGPVALLRRGQGAVERLAAIWADAPVLVDNAGVAAGLSPLLGGRVSVTRDVLPDALAEQIDALESPVVELPGGARLSIHPTPALIAIDVDAGSMTASREVKARAQTTLNHKLLPELARQIRLRNLSGGIVVDLAGMPARKRASLAPAFVAALADDPLRPRFLGFTALGLAEILRARVHPPLHELLAGPHAAGLAALRAMATAANASPSARLELRAVPAIVAALQADSVALDDFIGSTGQRPMLRSDPSLTTGWRLETERHA